MHEYEGYKVKRLKVLETVETCYHCVRLCKMTAASQKKL